jgi:hypothetical protein
MTERNVTIRSKFWTLVQSCFIVLAIGTCYSSFAELRTSVADFCHGTYCDTAWDCGDTCFCNRTEHTCYEGGKGN